MTDDKRKRRDDRQVFEGDFRLSHLFLLDVDAAASGHSRRARNWRTTARSPSAATPTWSRRQRRIAFAAAPTTMIRDNRSDIYIERAAAKGKGATAEKITTNLGPDTRSGRGRRTAQPSRSFRRRIPQRRSRDGIPLQHVGNEHLMLYDVAAKRTKDGARREFDLSPGALHWAADSRAICFSDRCEDVPRRVHRMTSPRAVYTQLTHGIILQRLGLSRKGRDRARHRIVIGTW